MNHTPPSMHRPSAELSRRLFWPAVLLCAVVKIWLSWGRYLNQDEFETLHQGWLIFRGAVPYRDFRSNHPPLAFQWLSWLNYLTGDASTIIYLGRFLTFVSTGMVLALLYRISRDVFGTVAARWTVIVYAVNATFWEWSTEIRTDFLLVPLWLMAVSLLFSRRPHSTTLRMLAIGLVMGTAFWVNQKALFHAVPIVILMMSGGPQRSWRLADNALAGAASLVPTSIVLAGAWANGSLIDLIQHNFLGSCAWGMVETNYYRAWRSVTLQRAVAHDAGFVVLALVACVWATGAQRTRSQFFIAISAIWMLLTLFLTPSPFAYYLLSVFPLFAVVSGGFLAQWPTSPLAEASPTARRRWLAAVAIGGFVCFPILRMTKFIRPTNRYQLAVVRLANELTSTETHVFDGAGTLVTRPDAYPFHWVLWQPELAAYRAGKLPPLVETLRENKCRLLIDTYRVRSLTSEDRRRLQTHFVQLWGPLCVPGYDSLDNIGSVPHEFELWYDGVYLANRSDVLVDGQPMTAALPLKAGRHRIALTSGPARVTLREITLDRVDHLPTDTTDPTEFLGKYGYGY